MASPVIDFTQSIPDFDQWEPWGVQPYATNFPVSWTARGLPPGVSINGASGLISGSSSLPGVYQFALVATNADGASAEAKFTVGIRPARPVPPSSAVSVVVDLDTRAVTFPGADAKLGLLLKRGDDVVFQIQFVRGNVGADLPISEMKLALKDDETEDTPLIPSSTFVKVGSGTNAVYRLYVKLAASDDAFPGYVADAAAADVLARSEAISLLGEFEWLETWTGSNVFGVGPLSLRSSSQNWSALLVRDLVPST